MFSLLSNVFPVKQNIRTESSDSNHNQSLLFISKDNSCKTSLLFQMIESIILEEYEEIHYIISGSDKIKEMPTSVNQMPSIDVNNGSVLEFLKVYYLSTYDSLVNHLLGIQSTNLCPIVIIIDDIYHYVKQFNQRVDRSQDNQPLNKRFKTHEKEEKQLMAELSTLLINTGNNCRQKLQKNSLIVMAVDLNLEDSSKQHKILQSIGHRFFDNVWTLEKISDSFDPIKYQMVCQINKSLLKIDFNLEDKQLFLNTISEKKI